MPLESDNVEGRLSRGIIVTITLVAALLLILNVVLISCYVRRRNAARKQLHGKKPRAFVYISVCLRFFCFLFPQGLFSSFVPSTTVNDRTPEFPLVIVLGVTAVITLSLLIVTLIAACVWRHRKRLGILGQKVRIEAACCCRGQRADKAGQGGSASTSEGKPIH